MTRGAVPVAEWSCAESGCPRRRRVYPSGRVDARCLLHSRWTNSAAWRRWNRGRIDAEEDAMVEAILDAEDELSGR